MDSTGSPTTFSINVVGINKCRDFLFRTLIYLPHCLIGFPTWVCTQRRCAHMELNVGAHTHRQIYAHTHMPSHARNACPAATTKAQTCVCSIKCVCLQSCTHVSAHGPPVLDSKHTHANTCRMKLPTFTRLDTYMRLQQKHGCSKKSPMCMCKLMNVGGSTKTGLAEQHECAHADMHDHYHACGHAHKRTYANANTLRLRECLTICSCARVMVYAHK